MSLIATETTTPTSPSIETFQQAFAAAKAEHSAPAAERAPAAGEASPDASESEPPTQDEPPAEAPATEPASDDEPGDDLLSDEEYAGLQSKHANDPAKLAKELKAVFTKKTQALAAQRKGVERLTRYESLIDNFEQDAYGTLEQLAQQYGWQLSPRTAGQAGDPATTPEQQEAVTTATDAVMATFREKLGPDLEYLADGLLPAVQSLVENLTSKAVEPVKAQTDALLTKAAEAQTAVVMNTFSKTHPDWKQHEAAMVKLSERLQPKGMAEHEYLDLLYTLATKDTQVASATKKVVAKMTKAAEAAEPTTLPTAPNKVRSTPPAAPSFMDAYQAAKRGERWED